MRTSPDSFSGANLFNIPPTLFNSVKKASQFLEKYRDKTLISRTRNFVRDGIIN